MAAELQWDTWPGFAQQTQKALEEYLWPGNVRELRNVVERAVYRWDDATTPIAHVQFDPFESAWKPISPPRAAEMEAPAPARAATAPDLDGVTDLRQAVEAHERSIIEHHLGRNRFNQRQTAKALGLSYDQLRHCMKKHGLTDRGAG
jgi:psp operon transcriptional activator